MSTRFTNEVPSMAGSNTLQLFLETAQINLVISKHLASILSERGYHSVTPAMLQFLSALECGANYASEIARQLGVSRQMVRKIVKELSQAGYLQQIQSPKRQKQIRFTAEGEALIAEAREILVQLDQNLFQEIDKTSIQETLEQLRTIQSVLQED